MPRRKTHEEFMIEMAVKNTKVTVLGTYVNKNTKVLVKCNTCGHEWMGNPGDLLTNHGCPECYNKRRRNNRVKTNEQFIVDLAKVNPNIEPLEEYVKSSDKIKCRCKVCGGEFPSKPNNLLTGHGCPECSLRSRVSKRTNTLDNFISRMNIARPTIRITGKSYVNNKTPIECKCKICGNKMKKRPDALLSGHAGCKTCGYEALHNLFSFTQEEFEKRAADSNPNVEILGKYYNNNMDVLCRCKICNNEWETKPVNILYNGSGCPKCCASHGEIKLNSLLNKYNIDFEEQYTFDGCMYNALLKFDAYDVNNNIAYEYQGEQHYYPVNFGGCDDATATENFRVGQIRDDIKRKYCKEHKIPLIEIPYWEYNNMEEFLIDKWKELNLNIA